MASKKSNPKQTKGGEKARDLFFTGVGFAAHAKERVAGLVDDLRKQGKISKPEGEKIVKDFIEETKKAREKFESDVKAAIKETVEKATLASQEELTMLKKRLLQLENKGLTAVKNVIERASGEKNKAEKKAKAVAATVKQTAKKAVAAKTPAKKAEVVKAGAKKVVKEVTAKPVAKKPAAKKAAAPAKKAVAAKKAAPAKKPVAKAAKPTKK